ncbi:MAG: M48 family metallopeptidase [Myxococcales bacterium]|nr:M48 family metallopeptidase [Myxococcales bacterium]
MVHTTRPGAVGLHREQMMFASVQDVEALASVGYDALLADAQKRKVLNRDKRRLKRLRRIADRLVPHTGVFRDDAPGWNWQVNLIQESKLNASCMPGGRIIFYSGIIERLRLTDDEIAAIMGHEIAHALREHARERISQQQSAEVGAAVTRAVAGKQVAALATDISRTFFLLPNSRLHEQESDLLGIELAARAGFDPRAAASVWKKMASKTSSSTPEFLSTHPSHESRIADLTEQAVRLMPLYEDARKPKPKPSARLRKQT